LPVAFIPDVMLAVVVVVEKFAVVEVFRCASSWACRFCWLVIVLIFITAFFISIFEVNCLATKVLFAPGAEDG
jgi:hypothetical protein